MTKKVFLYDGDCQFCSALASKLEERCLDKEIRFLSFRKFPEEELRKFHPALSLRLAEGNVQFILGNQRYPGFFAVRKLSHSLQGFRWFSPLLYLPLVPLFGILTMSLLKLRKRNS